MSKFENEIVELLESLRKEIRAVREELKEYLEEGVWRIEDRIEQLRNEDENEK